SEQGGAGAARLVVRLGLRSRSALCRNGNRSSPAQDSDTWRSACLERHLRGHRFFADLWTFAVLSSGRGVGRDLLLSRVHVDDQCFPGPAPPLGGSWHPPDERLGGHNRRRVLRRPHWRALWLALVVHPLWRIGHPARPVFGPISLRAAARRRR